MAQKAVVIMAVVLSLALAVPVLAEEPAGKSSQAGPGFRSAGYRGGFGPMAKFRQDEEVVRLRGQIREKFQALKTLFAKTQVDEDQARALHKEMTSLRNQLSEKRLTYALEFKKRNPDWQPRLGAGRGGRGPGRWQHGPGPGHWRGGWRHPKGGGASRGLPENVQQ